MYIGVDCPPCRGTCTVVPHAHTDWDADNTPLSMLVQNLAFIQNVVCRWQLGAASVPAY